VCSAHEGCNACDKGEGLQFTDDLVWTAPATPAFRAAWRDDKDALKQQGYRLAKGVVTFWDREGVILRVLHELLAEAPLTEQALFGRMQRLIYRTSHGGTLIGFATASM
jgi:hypothetical protein